MKITSFPSFQKSQAGSKLVTTTSVLVGLLASIASARLIPLIVWGTLPFFLVGAVGGAILGVVISGVIALIIWLRSKKTT